MDFYRRSYSTVASALFYARKLPFVPPCSSLLTISRGKLLKYIDQSGRENRLRFRSFSSLFNPFGSERWGRLVLTDCSTADFCEKWLKHQQICCLRIEHEIQKSKNKNANRTFLLLKQSPHFNHITQMVTFLLSNTRSPLSSQSLSIGSQSSRPRTIRDIFFIRNERTRSRGRFSTHYL